MGDLVGVEAELLLLRAEVRRLRCEVAGLWATVRVEVLPYQAAASAFRGVFTSAELDEHAALLAVNDER
jgi:hypothetical protein